MSVFKNDLMKGKTWFVSGGGTGIGKGIATMAASHGANVVIAGRRKEVLEETCKEIRNKQGFNGSIDCVQIDVRDVKKCEEAIKFTVDKYGGVDVLVNNAAGNFSSSIEDTSINGFKTVMDIDLFGSFNLSKAALEPLKKSGEGVIINITATLHYKASPFQMHASAAKAGIDVLTRVAGIEWAEYGIRTVSIAPGPIADTVGGPEGRVFGGQINAKSKEQIMKIVPTGRFGTVDDIAATALFVASPAGSFINATEIVVDGGHWHEASGRYLAGKEFIRSKSMKERKEYKGGVKKDSKL